MGREHTESTDHIPTAGLLDAVTEDGDRQPIGKETGVLWSKPDDVVRVNTAEASLMRRLLQHPHFELDYVEAGDGVTIHADDLTVDGTPDRVHSVHGRLPIACVTISAAPRSTSRHAPVVSKHGLNDPRDPREAEDGD